MGNEGAQPKRPFILLFHEEDDVLLLPYGSPPHHPLVVFYLDL
jgi:hypothetical protein